jgi:hypothetical protein
VSPYQQPDVPYYRSSRGPRRGTRVLFGLIAFFVVAIVLTAVQHGSIKSVAANTTLLGCPVGPTAHVEFNPEQPPMEIVAIWNTSSNAGAAAFIEKYNGCLTYKMSASGSTRAAGVPAGSSYELAEFFADASKAQIDRVTRNFESSGLFTKVKDARALRCPGIKSRSLGYCVTVLGGNEWAYDRATGP